VKILKAIAWSLVAIVSILFVVGIIIGPSAHQGEPARPAARQPASHSAPIVDGPVYLASKRAKATGTISDDDSLAALVKAGETPAPGTTPRPAAVTLAEALASYERDPDFAATGNPPVACRTKTMLG
jgi:hypothetical protein